MPERKLRPLPATPSKTPPRATAALALSDGTVFWGAGVGATDLAVGEVCFNTSITGYQEILTDPSYAGQIITFTFPHIGNIGANIEDIEATAPAARGLVLRADITSGSSWRGTSDLNDWLIGCGLVGISGLDTRSLTRRIRDIGAPNGAIQHAPDGKFDIAALIDLGRWLCDMGFSLCATAGTARTLTEAGLDVEMVQKVHEGRPHIVDAMISGDIQLVFNTTEGAKALSDSFTLRRTALIDKIPYYTTVAGCRAVVEAIAGLRTGSLEVAPLQSYFKISF